MAILTISEYLAIHLYENIVNYLPNYQQKDVMEAFYNSSGWLGGAYSFGGNRTVSGVILLSIFSYMDQHNLKHKWIIFLGSICCISGVAIGLTMLYLLISRIRHVKKSFITAGVALFLVGLFIKFVVMSDDEMFHRLSLNYLLDFMWDYKYNQVLRALLMLDGEAWTIFSGIHDFSSENLEVSGFGISFGDFMALEFFVHYGLIGSLIFVVFVLTRINKENYWPIFILVAGTFHYGIIFAAPGQLIFAYFLSRKGIK